MFIVIFIDYSCKWHYSAKKNTHTRFKSQFARIQVPVEP
jgi:hypothetical protein